MAWSRASQSQTFCVLDGLRQLGHSPVCRPVHQRLQADCHGGPRRRPQHRGRTGHSVSEGSKVQTNLIGMASSGLGDLHTHIYIYTVYTYT